MQFFDGNERNNGDKGWGNGYGAAERDREKMADIKMMDGSEPVPVKREEGMVILPAPAVAVATLGCKVNQYESAAIASLFRQHGYRVVEFSQPADVYIINTCTVTHLADRKSRSLIRRARRANPAAVVAVMGCYAQVAAEEITALKDVDVVVGTAERGRLVELVEEVRKHRRQLVAVADVRQQRDFEELPVEMEPNRVRAVVKVQEGCDHYCTYCIVPYARGPSRSRSPDRVEAEVRRLVAAGFKEIVLSGVHLGAYGRDLTGEEHRHGLAGLVKRVAAVPGLMRLRLSSIEPMDVNEELITVLAETENFCPHLHIPLQSGDDYILRRMGRDYTRDEYRRLTERLYQLIPDLALTTDVIVGFPGEEEEHFSNTYELVKEIGFAGMHVFRFSPRKGTPAASFSGQVPAAVKEERSNRLIALGRQLQLNFARRYLYRVVDVLVEEEVGPASGLVGGHTSNYLYVVCSGTIELRGAILRVRIREVREEPSIMLMGERVPAGFSKSGVEYTTHNKEA